ncbi:hypothetical protein N7497_004830 [Penicillium chrysogenum]|jgi:hypothetical protein|nr:hypothetical protein N7497_004830 [Penicillium chrysogenum]
MKVLLYFTLLGALVVLGVATSIPASPRDANRPQIATTEDIHDLPEGFTWDIVERPRGSDTRTKNPVSIADLQTDGLEKRAMGITCTGVSNKRQFRS